MTRPTAWIVSFALAFLTVALYWPTLHYPASVVDDPDIAVQNPHVQNGLSREGVRWAFTTFHFGNWQPLTWLSLELDSTLYGRNKEFGFHLTSVLVHALSSALLFLVLRAMTGSPWPSAFVAALFAWHPLNVESATWIAERKGVLGTLFWIIAMAAYVYYTRRPSIRRYLLLGLAVVLGLMAKPMLLPFPFVLLLLDYWPLGRVRSPWSVVRSKEEHARLTADYGLRTLVLEKLPLIVLVVGWSYLAFAAQQDLGAVSSLERYPPAIRLGNAAVSYVAYVWQMVFPWNLAFFYPHPGSSLSLVKVLGATLVLVVTTAIMLTQLRWRPYLAVGWFWYLGVLVPVIGLIQIGEHAMADRYMYVPAIGIFWASTWWVMETCLAHGVQAKALGRLGIGILAIFAVLSHRQMGYWRSFKDVWERSLAVNEQNAMAHNSLGTYYFRERRFSSAAEEFEQAVAIEPRSSRFLHNYALTLERLGGVKEAEQQCAKAFQLDPSPLFLHSWGNLLRQLGRDDEALAKLRTAIDQEPHQAEFHVSLGSLLAELGRREEAAVEYEKAKALNPDYLAPYVGLGNLAVELGDFKDAARYFRVANHFNPESPEPHVKRGIALQAQGYLNEARDEYEMAGEAGREWVLDCLRLTMAQMASRELTGHETDRERKNLAEFYRQPFVARYAESARLYALAFHDNPALADDPRQSKRFEAALAAAKAGLGKGKDPPASEEERSRLRRQASAWLQAELAVRKKDAARNDFATRAAVRKSLRMWQRNIDLAPLRDAAALKNLPETERYEWEMFWQEVESVRKSTVSFAPDISHR
jgi:Flp pilus assembly protein TadD